MRPPRRPERYRVRVQAPDWTAELLIEHGFCTEADGHLTEMHGKSAAWIYGHLRFHGWTATMLPAPAPQPQGELL